MKYCVCQGSSCLFTFSLHHPFFVNIYRLVSYDYYGHNALIKCTCRVLVKRHTCTELEVVPVLLNEAITFVSGMQSLCSANKHVVKYDFACCK